MFKQIKREHLITFFWVLLILTVAIIITINFNKNSENASNGALEDKNQKVLYDYIIKDGTVIDGLNNQAKKADIAIKNDKIAGIGKFDAASAKNVILAKGKIVCPGFIDIHTHTEKYWAADNTGEIVLKQGVTTQITGNCGTAVNDIGKWLKELPTPAINVGMFTGYKNLRSMAGLKIDDQANQKQIKFMTDTLDQSMKDGSFGLSIGLEYPTQENATTEELIVLAKIIKKHDKLFAMHIRSEGQEVIKALEELLTIGRSSGAKMQYSHIKISEKEDWDSQEELLQIFYKGILEGIDVEGDSYGYTYSSHDLSGGGGKASMLESNVEKVLKSPWVMIGSDSGLVEDGIAIHPRAYGNYIRILTNYVRDKKVLTLEQAIHKMTYMPAQRLKLEDRGRIKPGYKADIAIFDLDQLVERGTREKPSQLAEGMSYVFVNGKPAIYDGKIQDSRSGIALYNK